MRAFIVLFFLFFVCWAGGLGGGGFEAAAASSSSPAKESAANWLRGFFFPKSKAQSRPKLRPLWVADTIRTKSLRAPLFHGSPPLLADQMVIQANGVNGVKAFTKDRGRLIWEFSVKGGVSGALARREKALYFGGRDGFFYSVQLETGRLLWKFWTGSENLGSPLIYENAVYWAAANQNFYALSLKGKQLWMFPGPSLDRSFTVRGRPRPAAYKNLLYMGFYDGTVAAVDRDSGGLKWKAALPGAGSISEGLAVEGGCLFAPAAHSYLFCLDPLTGAIRWKAKGGGAFSLSRGFVSAASDSDSPVSAGAAKKGSRGKGSRGYLYHSGSWTSKEVSKGWLGGESGKPLGSKDGGRQPRAGQGSGAGGENPGKGNFLEALDKKSGKLVWRRPVKAYPAAPAAYRDYLVYGFLSRGELHIAHQKDGKSLGDLKFGRGLGASLTVDEEAGKIYFLSADGYLHKIRVDRF